MTFSRIVKTELGKSVFALWMIPCYVVAIMFSWLARGEFQPIDSSGDVESERIFEGAVPALLGCAFVGTWAVTREYYYSSVSRMVIMCGRESLYYAKVIAGVASGAIAMLTVLLAWLLTGSGGAAPVIDIVQAVDGGTVGHAGKLVLLGAVASMFGACVAWMVPSYYGASIVVLVVPVLVEVLPLYNSGDPIPFLPAASILKVAGFPAVESLSALGALLSLTFWLGVILLAGLYAVRRRQYG